MFVIVDVFVCLVFKEQSFWPINLISDKIYLTIPIHCCQLPRKIL